MKLGTSTNIVYIRPDGSRLPLEETLRLGAEAGFKEFDFNSYDWSLPGARLWDEDWEHWIQGIAEIKEHLGLKFSQSHAYTYHFLDTRLSEEDKRLHELMVERSLRCAQILGVKVVVTHPGTINDSINPIYESKKRNIEYFKRYIERSAAYGLAVAIENQWDMDVAPHRKYCSSVEELVDLVDTINDLKLGICWDFEHADLMEIDQPAALRFMGKRLMATHVSDHFSWKHPHIMPLFGQIAWKPIMEALKEIKYEGIFSLEAHNYTNKFPDELIQIALKFSRDIGEYLINLGEEV